jgi:hypothetical protein
MKPLTTIKVGWDNPLYLIVCKDGVNDSVGLDYTTNLIEFQKILNYHEEMGSTYEVYKIVNNKKEKL